jgi:hypothetical protein
MSINRDKATGRILAGSGGRPTGSRNRLQQDFMKALADDFAKHGTGVINIVRVEQPASYLKIIATVLPKELILTDNVLGDMTDEELLQAIEIVRAMRDATDAKALVN